MLKPEGMSEAEEERWAIETLSKCIQRRKAAQAFVAAVEQAKKMFLDPDALAAGASDNPLYSAAAMHIRGSLLHSEEVKAALTESWESLVPDDVAEMSREEYFTMMRKLYLFGAIEARDADLDPDDAISSAGKDWEVDSGGRDGLTREAFDRCWFQLADLNTEEVDADVYADWIRLTVSKLTYPTSDSPEEKEPSSSRSGSPAPEGSSPRADPEAPAATLTARRRRPKRGECVWRSDSDMIRELRDACVEEGTATEQEVESQLIVWEKQHSNFFADEFRVSYGAWEEGLEQRRRVKRREIDLEAQAAAKRRGRKGGIFMQRDSTTSRSAAEESGGGGRRGMNEVLLRQAALATSPSPTHEDEHGEGDAESLRGGGVSSPVAFAPAPARPLTPPPPPPPPLPPPLPPPPPVSARSAAVMSKRLGELTGPSAAPAPKDPNAEAAARAKAQAKAKTEAKAASTVMALEAALRRSPPDVPTLREALGSLDLEGMDDEGSPRGDDENASSRSHLRSLIPADLIARAISAVRQADEEEEARAVAEHAEAAGAPAPAPAEDLAAAGGDEDLGEGLGEEAEDDGLGSLFTRVRPISRPNSREALAPRDPRDPPQRVLLLANPPGPEAFAPAASSPRPSSRQRSPSSRPPVNPPAPRVSLMATTADSQHDDRDPRYEKRSASWKPAPDGWADWLARLAMFPMARPHGIPHPLASRCVHPALLASSERRPHTSASPYNLRMHGWSVRRRCPRSCGPGR